MRVYFDRYKEFRTNGEIKVLPFIRLQEKSSDLRVLYKQGRDRLDILSQRYYGNPFHGWLILLANPQFGGLEFDIPDNEVINIPYPFRDSIQEYTDKVQRHINLYGI